MKFNTSIVRIIKNDEDKTSVEVGPDKDGLGCVEIRSVNEDGVVIESMIFNPQEAILISQAMSACSFEITQGNKS